MLRRAEEYIFFYTTSYHYNLAFFGMIGQIIMVKKKSL